MSTTESADRTKSAEPDPMLVQFLRERDVECPTCRYNLRNLARSTCPECDTPLALTLDPETRSLWFFAFALVPPAGTMYLLLLFIVLTVLYPGGPELEAVPFICASFLSLGAGAVLIAESRRFSTLPVHQQWGWAALSWSVHVGGFILLIAYLA